MIVITGTLSCRSWTRAKRTWPLFLAVLSAANLTVLSAWRVQAAPAEGAVTVVTLNPYADISWDRVEHLRANLHTHSTQSDGSLPPHQVVDEYHQRGYKILALTDHDKVTYPWTEFTGLNANYTNRDPAALGMLSIIGNELSRHHHSVSLFSALTSVSNDLDTDLTALGQYAPESRAFLCHPAMHWPGTFGPQRGFKTPLAPELRLVTQGDFTIEAWFRTADTNRNVMLGNFSADYAGSLNLELHTDNRVRLYVQSAAGKVTDLNLAADTLGINTRDSQWHHLAGTRSNNVALLYLDGRLVGQKTDVAGAYDLQGDHFFLGRDTRGGTLELKGDLDLPRIWTRALAPAEVARLAAGEVPGDDVSRTGLLSEYTFDRPPQTDDTAGHADGPLHALRHGPGYRLSMTPSFRQITRGDFTVEAWFRTTDTGRNILLGNFTSVFVNALNLELHTDNRVRLYIQPPAGEGSTFNLYATPSVNTRDGRWRHLAGIRRDGIARLYLDGQEVGNAADTAGAFDLSGDYYYLGRDSRSDATVFYGDLAPVRIWNRALTAAEVSAIAAGDRMQTSVQSDGMLARYALDDSTTARETANAAGGPFTAYSTAFSSLMRIYDVAAPLLPDSHSHSALRLGWALPPPTQVQDEAVSYYLGLYQRHAHLRCIEVLNGTRPLAEYALDRELWDALLARLMPERPVWGVAVDDMHSMSHLGRDSVVFLSETMSEASIRTALDAGSFYFATKRIKALGGTGSEPPRLDRIQHDPVAGRITLTASSEAENLPDSSYVWVSMGKTVHTGPVLDYRSNGLTGSYVRAEITGPGGTAYTNPFGLTSAPATADADGDGLPDWWELAHFGNHTVAVPTALSPSGMTLEEHYIVGSDPSDPAAAFRIVSVANLATGFNHLRLRWPSAAGRLYSIITAPTLSDKFVSLEGAESITGAPPYNDYYPPVTGPSRFYKITVRLANGLN